jgi:hypothetical protein
MGTKELEVSGRVVREAEGGGGEHVEDNGELLIEFAEAGRRRRGAPSSAHAPPVEMTDDIGDEQLG